MLALCSTRSVPLTTLAVLLASLAPPAALVLPRACAAAAPPPSQGISPAVLPPAAPYPSRPPLRAFEAVLQPATAATVRAQRTGIVTTVRVEVGDSVAVGDTLLRLDDLRLCLDNAAAELVCQQTRLRLERFRTLSRERLLAAQELEQVEFDAKSADLRLQQASLALAQAVVTSPLHGQVTGVQVALGSHVNAGEPCLVVADARDLAADLLVPVDQLPQIRVDQRVTATALALAAADGLDPAPGPTGHAAPPPRPVLRGRICRVAPTVDPATGLGVASARFPDAGSRYRPGTVVQVWVVGE